MGLVSDAISEIIKLNAEKKICLRSFTGTALIY